MDFPLLFYHASRGRRGEKIPGGPRATLSPSHHQGKKCAGLLFSSREHAFRSSDEGGKGNGEKEPDSFPRNLPGTPDMFLSGFLFPRPEQLRGAEKGRNMKKKGKKSFFGDFSSFYFTENVT